MGLLGFFSSYYSPIILDNRELGMEPIPIQNHSNLKPFNWMKEESITIVVRSCWRRNFLPIYNLRQKFLFEQIIILLKKKFNFFQFFIVSDV
jgi:hypothetical protein